LIRGEWGWKGMYIQQAHGNHITEEYTDSRSWYISKQLNRKKEIQNAIHNSVKHVKEN